VKIAAPRDRAKPLVGRRYPHAECEGYKGFPRGTTIIRGRELTVLICRGDAAIVIKKVGEDAKFVPLYKEAVEEKEEVVGENAAPEKTEESEQEVMELKTDDSKAVTEEPKSEEKVEALPDEQVKAQEENKEKTEEKLEETKEDVENAGK